VHPSPARPHFLERYGPEQGVFVRVGSTNRRADAAQIEQMRRYALVEAFDEQPMPGVRAEALDFRAASEYFAEFRRLTPSAFATLISCRLSRVAGLESRSRRRPPGGAATHGRRQTGRLS